MMKLPIDSKTLKTAGKVAVAVGAGAALEMAGTELAKRGLASVNTFAQKSAVNNAIVGSVAGLGMVAAGLMVYGKVTSPGKATAARPFAYGGALLSAWTPVVAPKVAGAIASVFDKLLPAPKGGGYYRDRFPGGVAGQDLPALPRGGGAASTDVPMGRRRAGGVASLDVPMHMPL